MLVSCELLGKRNVAPWRKKEKKQIAEQEANVRSERECHQLKNTVFAKFLACVQFRKRDSELFGKEGGIQDTQEKEEENNVSQEESEDKKTRKTQLKEHTCAVEY